MIPFKYCNRIGYKALQQGKNCGAWYPSDEEWHYKRVCVTSSKHAKRWNNVDITYNLNDYGFRNDFNFATYDRSKINQPVLLVLGCSHTFGVGLPKDNSWGELLAKNLNYFCVNLGVPSGSFDSISRVSKEWLDIIKPDLIIIQSPETMRREYILNREIYQAGGWTKNKWLKFSATFWDDDENEYNKQKNIDLVNYYNTNNIPTHIYKLEVVRTKDWDKARDGIHYGPKVHLKFAEMIYNELERDIH